MLGTAGMTQDGVGAQLCFGARLRRDVDKATKIASWELRATLRPYTVINAKVITSYSMALVHEVLT